MARNTSSRAAGSNAGGQIVRPVRRGGPQTESKSVSAKAGKLLAASKLSYQAVKSGVSADVVRGYLEQGRLRRRDVAMVIPTRTFERRLSEHQNLRIDEADAIARLLRVRDHARRVFEDDDLAEEWLTLPNPELGNEVPIEMARTDVGAREVEAVLGRIEHGIFA